MQYTQLGQRGPSVSTIGFGTWSIGGRNWGPTDDEISRNALRQALDLGVTLIDTADVYGNGHSEELIAEVFKERGRGEVILASKAGNDFYNATQADDTGFGPIRSNYDKKYLLWAVERSLKRLQVETIDILQLHSPPTEMLRWDDPWAALEQLKRQGKIRWAGWSLQSFRETEQAFVLDEHHDLLDVIQVRYNLLEREAEKVLFPKAQQYGIGIVVRTPLLFGLLTGKFERESRFGDDDHRRRTLSPEKLKGYFDRLDELESFYHRYPDQTMAQVSLRFCISHPACHLAIPGAKTPQQVEDNCAASDLGPIPWEEIPKVE
jgi:aryl-alcohol dehydrogenase-like predicted oxidoreductase